MTVYLLWESDGETKLLDTIFAHKIDAEKTMRLLKEQDAQHGRAGAYHYWIQEKEVHQ